jgi:hypothetical protein
MKLEWIVEVRDHAGAPVASAEVAFFRFDPTAFYDVLFANVPATHVHRGGGRYEPSAPISPAEDRWLLMVRDAGKSTVVQPLVLRQSAAAFTMSPDGGLAATVVPHRMTVAVGAQPAHQRTVLQVTLRPASEVVFLCGYSYEYEGATDFRDFADGRREQLWRDHAIDAGTLITTLDCGRAVSDVWVRAQSATRWLRIYESKKPRGGLDTPNDLKAEARQLHHEDFRYTARSGKDVSITDLYAYLDSVGRRDPGSVREVSIFSHAHPGGPILFNTYDPNPYVGARRPQDFDARPKDFNAQNYGAWQNMASALDASATWRIWGCRATAHLKQVAREAVAQKEKGTSPTTFFQVESRIDHGTRYRATVRERLTLAIAKKKFDDELHSGYPNAVAAALGIDVWASPPGAGADYKRVGSLWKMEVVEHPAHRAYLRDEFSPEFVLNSSGYINYTRFLSRPPLPAVPFSSKHYYLMQETRHRLQPGTNVHVVLGTTYLRFLNDKSTEWNRSGYVHDDDHRANLVTAGVGGFFHTLKKSAPDQTGPAEELFVYVQDDGQAFTMTRLASGTFQVLSPL